MIRGDTWTRLRRQVTVDPYSGEQVLADWDSPDQLPIRRCGFAPATAQEFPDVEREQLHHHGTLYMPYAADAREGDRVESPTGEVWSVDGDRSDWRNPMTGRKHGSVVRLKRVRG